MRILLILLFVCSVGHSQTIINSYRYGGCSLTAGNVVPSGSAASECTQEANSVGGWVNESGTTVASVVPNIRAVPESQYVIEITTIDSSGSDRAKIDLPLDNGGIYSYEFWARQTVGVNGETRQWFGVVSSPQHDFTSTWVKYTGTFTVNQVGAYPRFYAANGPGNAGDKVQIDNFIVIKTN